MLALPQRPNWSVKRTQTLAMPSAFSWPVLVPSALSASGAAYRRRYACRNAQYSSGKRGACPAAVVRATEACGLRGGVISAQGAVG